MRNHSFLNAISNVLHSLFAKKSSPSPPICASSLSHLSFFLFWLHTTGWYVHVGTRSEDRADRQMSDLDALPNEDAGVATHVEQHDRVKVIGYLKPKALTNHHLPTQTSLLFELTLHHLRCCLYLAKECKMTKFLDCIGWSHLFDVTNPVLHYFGGQLRRECEPVLLKGT